MTIDELKKMVWNARWIWGPGPGDAVLCPPPNPDPFSMRYFRRTFELDDPSSAKLTVHVSADSRYRLSVNGRVVGRGPVRGDLSHYAFETYDLSGHLRRGMNVIAAQVQHMGLNGPIAEMHDPHGGFVLQGSVETSGGEPIILDTDDRWQCLVDTAYTARMCDPGGAFFVNPFDAFDGAQFPWGWAEVDYDDGHWQPVLLLPRASGRNQLGHPRHRWRLVPREIAPLAETPVVPEAVLDAPGSDALLQLLRGERDEAIEIPPHSTADWTVSMGKLFTGYPTVETSGGRGTEILIRYAEALSRDGEKRRRDDLSFGEVEENQPSDLLRPGGGDETWEPLWYRCGRFIRVIIRTGDEPLRLRGIGFRFTSYPFQERATFESDDSDLKAIWDIGWHTALCCAHEHYEDCPFYEQLQYLSDTRLQILISYYVAGDDALARQAIKAFDRSLLPEGLTQSRFPSNLQQIIPTFSLMYPMMIEDHWQHWGDRAFLASVAPGIGPIMHWFERHMNADGLVGRIPWWVFADWRPKAYPQGVPPEAEDGPCTLVNMLYIASLDSSARLYRAVGDPHHAGIWEKRAATMRQAAGELLWNEAEGLFADGPGSRNFSQHSNLWAILSGAASEEQTERIMRRLMDDPDLIQTTYIFDYYLFQTLLKVGAHAMLDRIIDRWRAMVDYGFSTFPEKPEPARSDCHAWSAWPMVEFLRTGLGVQPREPGFASVIIAPVPLAGVDEARGTMPTCRGPVAVAWRRDGQRFALKARVPEGMPAEIRLPTGERLSAAAGGEVALGDRGLLNRITLPNAKC